LLIYFALNFYFASNRSKVIDRLGKYLAPILILFMIILVIKGIVAPLASPVSPGSPTAFTDGILNGYNTMNALGAALFGLWLINEFSMRGLKDRESRKNNLIIIGSITAFGLFLTSTVLTYLGASSGAKFPEAPIGVLTVEFARGLLGYFGIIVFAIILSFANITTSVGLTSTAGDTFEQDDQWKIKIYHYSRFKLCCWFFDRAYRSFQSCWVYCTLAYADLPCFGCNIDYGLILQI